MSGLLRSVSGWAAGYRHVRLPEPWYKLTHAGRKRVLCVPDGPGSSILFWRHTIYVRLRDSDLAEQFEARITGVSQHASVRSLLELEGPETLPGLITDQELRQASKARAAWDKAVRVQLALFDKGELARVREWGIIALRVAPQDPITLHGAPPEPTRGISRRRAEWYTRLFEED